MRGSTSIVTACALLAMTTSAACESAPGPDIVDGYLEFEIENQTRHLCAGSLPHLNSHIERVFGFLDTVPPSDFRVRVRVVDEPPCDAGACYRHDQRAIYIKRLDAIGHRTGGVLRHETSHAVIHQVWGGSAPFFAEGLAESLTRTLIYTNSADEPAPVGDTLDGPAKQVDYVEAARFTRFLIDTRGLDAYKELFTGADGRSGAEIRELFAEVYGEDFAALEAEYLSGPPRCPYQLDLCDAQSVERVDDVWSVEFTASCDDPEFYGSVSSEDLNLGTQRSIDIVTAGRYRMRSSAPVVVIRCGGCDVQDDNPVRFPVLDLQIDLDAGLHTLEFMITEEAVVTFELAREVQP